MALPPRLGPTPPSEPFSHPPGAPRELNTSGCTICSTSGEERIRYELGLLKLWSPKGGGSSRGLLRVEGIVAKITWGHERGNWGQG